MCKYPFTSKNNLNKNSKLNFFKSIFYAPKIGKTVFDLVKGKKQFLLLFIFSFSKIKEEFPLAQALIFFFFVFFLAHFM